MGEQTRSGNGPINKWLFFVPTLGGAAAAGSLAEGAGAAHMLNDSTNLVVFLSCAAAAFFLVSCYGLWEARKNEIMEDEADSARARRNPYAARSSENENKNSIVVLHLALMFLVAVVAATVTACIIQATTPLTLMRSGN